jgi:hypothetical protein
LIITTHEQNIFFALKPIIAKRELPFEKVSVYELRSSERGSSAEKLNLTSDGTIKGGISSFVEAERKMVYEWSLTIPSVEEEKR